MTQKTTLDPSLILYLAGPTDNPHNRKFLPQRKNSLKNSWAESKFLKWFIHRNHEKIWLFLWLCTRPRCPVHSFKLALHSAHSVNFCLLPNHLRIFLFITWRMIDNKNMAVWVRDIMTLEAKTNQLRVVWVDEAKRRTHSKKLIRCGFDLKTQISRSMCKLTYFVSLTLITSVCKLDLHLYLFFE
jgi:hypothetical protein